MTATIVTFFNTRKNARTFAIEKGLNTAAVIDYAKTVNNPPIGERWAVRTAAITAKTRTLTIVTTGDGYHKRERHVQVITKKTRKFSIPIAA